MVSHSSQGGQAGWHLFLFIIKRGRSSSRWDSYTSKTSRYVALSLQELPGLLWNFSSAQNDLIFQMHDGYGSVPRRKTVIKTRRWKVGGGRCIILKVQNPMSCPPSWLPPTVCRSTHRVGGLHVLLTGGSIAGAGLGSGESLRIWSYCRFDNIIESFSRNIVSWPLATVLHGRRRGPTMIFSSWLWSQRGPWA